MIVLSGMTLAYSTNACQRRISDIYYQRFIENEDDRISIIDEVINRPDLTPIEVFEILDTCFEPIMRLHYLPLFHGAEDALLASKWNEIMDYCYEKIFEYHEKKELFRDSRYQKAYYDFVMSYTISRIITACANDEKQKVDSLLDVFFYTIAYQYENMRDDLGKYQPFTQLYEFAFYENVIKYAIELNRASLIVKRSIDLFEIERRIEEDLPSDCQDTIDRILADQFYLIIQLINKAIEENQNGSTALSDEEIEILKYRLTKYSTRIDTLCCQVCFQPNESYSLSVSPSENLKPPQMRSFSLCEIPDGIGVAVSFLVENKSILDLDDSIA